jgi:sugar phosphate isomerase/epimerase
VQIGIFTRTFDRPTLAEKLDAVARHGIAAVQLDLADAGLPPLPDQITPPQAGEIRDAFAARGIQIAAVSGTYNMIHPDLAERRAGLRRLDALAAACPLLGASVITLCTGTRNRESMWRPHPDNGSPEAWADLLAEMGEAVQLAEARGVTLAFEPEVANVVDSGPKARRLLDELRSPRLKVVMDGANVFHAGELPRMWEILDEAFALLGPDIALAHAKDLDRDGAAGHLPAGHGKLDYDRYVELLRRAGYAGPLVLHGLSEEQVPGCVAFLREKLTGFGG